MRMTGDGLEKFNGVSLGHIKGGHKPALKLDPVYHRN
jgi:hypothetical protein